MVTKNRNILAQASMLWPFISRRKKRDFYVYAFLTCISALADLMSIGILIPFIMVFLEPDRLLTFTVAKPVFGYFNLTEKSNMQFWLSIFFTLAVISSGVVKISLAWFQSRLSYGVAAELASLIFEYSLHRPYEYHLDKNSSDIVSAIANKANIVADNVIHPVLSFLLAFVTVFALGLLLLLINPLITSLIFLLVGGVYILVASAVRSRVAAASTEVATRFDSVMRIIREGLEGVRYVMLTGVQSQFVQEHAESEIKLRMSQANISFASLFTRAVVETFALLIFAWIIFFFIGSTKGNDSSSLLATMGAIILAMQRLLPVGQQAYHGWAKLAGSRSVIEDTLEFLVRPEMPASSGSELSELDEFKFENKIVLEDVHFSYNRNAGNTVLRGINLEISRSSKIGITGQSGSGKSTFLDLVMGFLDPTSGRILVDGLELKAGLNVESWQSRISLVPQQIYLADSSILSNIAFGCDERDVDLDKIEEILEITQLHEFVNSLQDKYYYRVGE